MLALHSVLLMLYSINTSVAPAPPPAPAPQRPQPRSPRPHILLIVADDLGWNDVPWHGSNQIQTPTLARLAAEGIILENLYVEPICSPTRASLLSGRHIIHTGIFQPLHTGVFSALNQSCNLPTAQHCLLLPAALKELGYATAAVGKWHLGYWNWLQTPLSRGFDQFYGYLNGEQDYYTHTTSGGYDFYNGTTIDFNANGTYSTELFTQRAVEVVAAATATVPLFVYLAWQAMHVPLEAPPGCITPYLDTIADLDRRLVAGMVSCMDAGVAKVLAALSDNNDMLSETTILFLADNGGPAALGDVAGRDDPADAWRSNYASNMPLRGQKTTYFEGGVKSAAFVSGFGVNGGRRNRALIHVCDLYPSLLNHAAAGTSILATPGGPAVAGDTARAAEDVLLLLGGEKQPPFTLGDGIQQWSTIVMADDQLEQEPRNETLHCVHIMSEGGPAVLRVGDWKLFANGTAQPDWWDAKNAVWFQTVGQSATSNNFTIQCPPPPQEGGNATGGTPIPPPAGHPGYCKPNVAPCLFNIKADPCEQRNVAANNSAVVAALLARLEDFRLSAYRDMTVHRKALPDQCLPPQKNNTWAPCFGTPPLEGVKLATTANEHWAVPAV